MDRRLIVLEALLLAILAAAIIVLVGPFEDPDDGGDDDPEDVPPVYPEGFTVDPEVGRITYVSETSWHIMDLMAPYMVKEGRDWVPYDGYEAYGSSISLDPGIYSISADGKTFDAIIGDTVSFEASWEYKHEGVVHQMDIEYTLHLKALNDQRLRSVQFNDTAEYMFYELPGLVEVDKDIRSLVSTLEREYRSIGGDVRDRQGYANFLASFVQYTIVYPSSIDGTGYDYHPYGRDEYWAMPLETLSKRIGDCDDSSVLLCAMYDAAGYTVAVGGLPGHVVAGVAIDGFTEVSKEVLDAADPPRRYKLAESVPLADYSAEEMKDVVFYGVETIYPAQIPVGYLQSGSQFFGMETMFGTSGFYPLQGADPGIQGSS